MKEQAHGKHGKTQRHGRWRGVCERDDCFGIPNEYVVVWYLKRGVRVLAELIIVLMERVD